jgi:DNA-binding Xre family transcriptional regulator
VTKRAGTVTISRAEYEELLRRLEDAEDLRDLRFAAARTDAADYLSADLVKRMIAGESKVRIWWEHRGMTAKALADQSTVSAAYLSQIETGAKPGSVRALTAIARTLRVAVDDLI